MFLACMPSRLEGKSHVNEASVAEISVTVVGFGP